MVASLAMGQIGSVRELNLKEGSILENAYRFAVTARTVFDIGGCSRNGTE